MGRELCVQLAAEGANIALCDVHAVGMADTRALCLEANASVTVTTFECDVSNEAQVLSWRDAVLTDFGRAARVALFNNVSSQAEIYDRL